MQYLRGKGRTSIDAGEDGTSPYMNIFMQLKLTLKRKMDALPCWAMEGGATFIQILFLVRIFKIQKLILTSLETPPIRDSQQSGDYVCGGNPEQLFSWVKLTEKQNTTQCGFPGKLGYSLGMLFYEQLLARTGQRARPSHGWKVQQRPTRRAHLSRSME